MMQKKLSILMINGFLFVQAFSQAITEDAISVDKNLIQVETVTWLDSYDLKCNELEWNLPSILLRYGVQSNIEMRIATNFEGKKHIHSMEVARLGNIEAGFKLHILKGESFNLSALHHIIFPRNFETNEINASTSLIASEDINEKIQIGCSVQYLFEKATNFNVNYSFVIYYNISNSLNVHIETFGDFFESNATNNVDFGLDWVVSETKLIQAGMGTGLNETHYFVSAGFVWVIN